MKLTVEFRKEAMQLEETEVQKHAPETGVKCKNVKLLFKEKKFQQWVHHFLEDPAVRGSIG